MKQWWDPSVKRSRGKLSGVIHIVLCSGIKILKVD